MRQLCNGVQRNIASQQIFRICVKLRQTHDIPLRIGISSRFLGSWRGLPGVVRRAVSARDRYTLTDIFNRILSEVFWLRCPVAIKLCHNMTKSRRIDSVRGGRRSESVSRRESPGSSRRCRSHFTAVRASSWRTAASRRAEAGSASTKHRMMLGICLLLVIRRLLRVITPVRARVSCRPRR